ncbi:aa3-type cytochrome c oxidase subunit IV [Sphingomonas sp. Leaf357]|nr:aa3-type cytochrome c oxidase subunit IV [Sphingomonas sp. Leaf357]
MAGNGDLKAHEQTYGQVIGLLKWGAVACAVIAAAVIWLISR